MGPRHAPGGGPGREVTAKGRTTGPRDVRTALGLSPGDRILWEVGPDGTARVRRPGPVDVGYLRAAEGALSGWASETVEEAYRRYGLVASRAGTYLARFRAVARKHPHKKPGEILADPVDLTPGEEGKWFAAAKSAKLFDEAVALANRTPCSPQTLTRAARDFADENPAFALEAGLAALRWIVEGYGYEVTGLDVLDTHTYTMRAAENAGRGSETRERVRRLLAGNAPGRDFVAAALDRRVGLS